MVLACSLFFSANNARFAACQKPRCSCARKSLRCAPKEVHEYVRHVFEISDGLRTQLAAAISNPLFYEASITDTDGMVLPRPTRISRERSCLEGLLSFS